MYVLDYIFRGVYMLYASWYVRGSVPACHSTAVSLYTDTDRADNPIIYVSSITTNRTKYDKYIEKLNLSRPIIEALYILIHYI